MKYTEMLKDFLADYMFQHVKIVSKVGTVHEGYLQCYGDLQLVISDATSTILDLKDIATIEETSRNARSFAQHVESLKEVP
jgi:hypothetical protein